MQFLIGAGLAIIAAYFIGRRITAIANQTLRRSLITLQCAILPILWFGINALDGCYPGGPGGERCFGFGFGTVLLAPPMAMFALSSVIGYFLSVRRKI